MFFISYLKRNDWQLRLIGRARVSVIITLHILALNVYCYSRQDILADASSIFIYSL